MQQEKKHLDLSELKDTDPIIGYEQSEEAEAELVELNSTWDNVVSSFKHNRMAMIGLVVIILMVLTAIFAPLVSPYDPYVQDLRNKLAKPSAEHLLGTDSFGRDLLTRIFYGARNSLVIGLIPSMISIVIGTVMGLLAGYMGKVVDSIIMRIADIVLSFPTLLLAMVIMYTLGASLLNLFIALAIVNWGITARTVRAQTLQLREKEFVEAARSVGVKKSTIMFRHILPNCIPSLIVIFTLDIPSAIMSEASLSFLGVGAQPPEASWGLMVSENKDNLTKAPWVALAPGFAIMLLVLAFNFVGDGLRDALDPTLKE
ncbi:MAG: ABC transporter permease [Christensenellales bacterium]